jgi:phosphatidylglycerophosphate synthase
MHPQRAKIVAGEPRSLESPGWSLPGHATVVLTALALSVIWSQGWPLAVGAGLSFTAQLVRAAGRWTPKGGFGLANALTLLRVLLLLTAAAWLFRLPDGLLLALLLLPFVLDAADGAVARRLGETSEFGATFDTETDAIFVLILGLALWRRDGVGGWVMIPGLLRYVYVLCFALFPGVVERNRRPVFGRMAFLASSTLLLVAKDVHGNIGKACATVGAAISCVSFARSFLRAYPGWRRLSRIRPMPRLTVTGAIVSTLLFLVAWSLLNLTVNVRYPSPEPAYWYFLPSLDVTVLLAGLAVIGILGWRLPGAVRAALVILFVLFRGLRIGDGIAGQSFGKLFNVYSDLPLVPELIRYAHSTFSPWKFYGSAMALLAALALLAFALDRALFLVASFLQRRWSVLLFVLLALPFAIGSAFTRQDPRYNQRYAGAFGASILPRVQREVTFLLNVYDHRMRQMHAIAVVQETLHRTPAHLERLHRSNVYLFFVESYGATVVNRPTYLGRALPALRTLQERLGSHGFSSASGRLDSATYGGMSWLAHATFLTGVRTDSQLQYDLLAVARPRTLARIAHEAGYRTILVEPNTNRQSRGADFYDFDQSYKAWNFDYAGPPFAWATMPDQYVLDFVRRSVVARESGPLFLTYVLVSSHAPWSQVPTVIEDWSRIGNGHIYWNHPLLRANTNWPDFSNASEPYLRSIFYDLAVLGDYITRFITDDSLIIILGDHQPVSELTEDSPSWAVPVHVISKNGSLIQPFLGRGYVPGMVPGQTSAPMESFLAAFLRDFDEEQSDAYADGQHRSGS